MINNENLLACQIIFQPPLTRVRTPSHLIVSHVHFLLAMCLLGSLNCYVCYVLNKDYRYCVKYVQFLVKLVAGYITTLVIGNENLLACQIILLYCFSFLIKRWQFLKLLLNLFFKKYFKQHLHHFQLSCWNAKDIIFSFAMLLSFCVICKLHPRLRGKSWYGLP